MLFAYLPQYYGKNKFRNIPEEARILKKSANSRGYKFLLLKDAS